MTPGNSLPQVTEAQASGLTAEVYADIRATLGVPIVNLIWRHLASIDGALPVCWQIARPLYASGLCACSAARLSAAMNLPVIDEITPQVLQRAGIGAPARNDILRIIDAYHRANPLNWMALQSVEWSLTENPAQPPRRLPSLQDAAPIDNDLPPIPLDGSISPDTASLIEALNAVGSERGAPFPPTLYRHLAHWPGFLQLIHAQLQPLHDSGRLIRAIEDLKQLGKREAVGLTAYVATTDAVAPALRRAIRQSLSPFTSAGLPRLIVIIGVLYRALNGSRGADLQALT